MRRADLNRLSGTEALKQAGFGHRPAAQKSLGDLYQHDVFRLSDGVVVATLDAHGAHDFAWRAISDSKKR